MKSWNPFPLLFAVLIASVLMAFAPRPADATPPSVQRTTTIYPTADITIKSNAATDSTSSLNPSWSTSPTVQQKVLIKFSTDQIPSNIVSATIVFNSFSSTSGYSKSDVFVCSGDFTNSTNYSTGNALIGGSAGSRAGIVNGDEFTYTLTNHSGRYAIVMTQSSSNMGLHSSETNGTANDPHIDYVYTSPATPGDSNLDGVFTSADLVLVYQAGRYEMGSNPTVTWAQGDWDEDGDFDSSDLILAFQVGGYEGGTQAAMDYWESLND